MTMITTRRATSGDIEEFKKIIVASVLQLCKGHYTSEELKSLLAQYPSRKLYEKWIHERVLVVAEYDDKIVGFAQYFPPNSSIEAVHVLPGYGKRGVGKMLVMALEEIAKHQGANKVILDSSLNAIGFYEKCGYVRKESSTFKCNDGVELSVVSYEKTLYG